MHILFLTSPQFLSGKRTKTIAQVSTRLHIVWITRTIKYLDPGEKWNALDQSRFHTIAKRMSTMKKTASNRELNEWKNICTTSEFEFSPGRRKRTTTLLKHRRSRNDISYFYTNRLHRCSQELRNKVVNK